MPAPYDAPERVQWRVDNADLMAWFAVPANLGNSAFLASLNEQMARYGSLTPAQTAAARRVMDEQIRATPDNTTLAATAEDAVNIYNGTYTINDGEQHLTYKIHTVRNGRLAGKRVIKRQMQYGEFAGFAFLTAEGGVQVWRRFYPEEAAGERFIVWSRVLLRALADGTNADHFAYAEDGIGYQVQASRTCRACNRALTTPTSIERGIGPECEGRQSADRTTAADAHESIASFGEAAQVTAEAMRRIPFPETEPLADTVQPAPIPDVQADPDDMSQDLILARLPRVATDRERFLRLYNRLSYFVRVEVCEDCGRRFNGRRGVAMHRRHCPMRVSRVNEQRRAEADRRAARLAQQEAEALARGPILSELGTRFGGQVWEQ